MDAEGRELDPLGLCRVSKHQHMLERFPFMRARWSRWLPFGSHWTEKERLQIFHALAPFRELRELDGACSVILTASQRRSGRTPLALQRLLVGLRYLDAAERKSVYCDPPAWLERVGRLTATAARCARARRPLLVAPTVMVEPTTVEAPVTPTPDRFAA